MTERQHPLTTEAIVGVAITIADREGLDAVSMRRVGSAMGYTGMSLYGHVATKHELLDLMADHVIGEVSEIDLDAPWPTALENFFSELHSVLLAHRGLAPVFTMRPTRGPNTLRHSRNALTVLANGGVPASTAVDAYIALSCYTMGSALYTSARATDSEPDPAWVGFGETLSSSDAAAETLASRAGPERFRHGLDHLIRGYAADLQSVEASPQW